MNIRGLKPGTVFFLLTLPAVLLYCLFFLAPVFIGFYYSLTNWDGFSLSYDMVGLQNYIDILQDKRFLNGLTFTMLYTVIVVIGKLSVALILALLLSRSLKFRGLFRSIYFFPAVLSMITVGLMFNQFFYSLFPPIGEQLGIEWLSRNLLGNPDTAIFGIALTNIWQGFAIPMVIFIAGLSNVPKDIIEASVIDGSTPVQRFFSITIPFLIPMLTVNVVLAIKGGLTVFDYIVAMTNGGPSQSTESLGFLIYQHGMSEMKFGYGTAEAIYVFILIGIISFIQIKLLSRKEVGQQ
ncbi:multiple sugar ABC transporter membrane protein [Paenibacillus uliginis N3/975]|uniref:Multiple sugar ABC transporter membrane protein n=1 Tax=Paenibacillus uliginis N3/975 TaxID=1313296 RepID=A0A1X7HSC1_9BACL|nr:sugar ABC transporter permease [Paenibacillus uliginis]SMF91437.1 multiple sugar ABC transporter membrane protein [Paenibacillus uliginis N3/975]